MARSLETSRRTQSSKDQPMTDSGYETRRPLPPRYDDGSYVAANPDWHHRDAPWKASQVRRMIEAHGLRPTSVCDVGCGTGGVLEQLARVLPPSTELVGYEPSLAVPVETGADASIRIVRGRLDELLQRQFDLVLVLDVFEHVEDCFGFLRGIRPLGQTFLFHIPLELSVQAVLRMSPLLHARRSVGHLHHFSEETALATLRDCGFSVVDSFLTRSGTDAPPRSLRQRLVRFPRRAAAVVNPHLAARIMGGFSLAVLATPE